MPRKRTETEAEYHARQAQHMREYRRIWKRQGYCAWCPNRAEPGRVLCTACADRNALRQAQDRARAQGRPIPTTVHRTRATYIVRREPKP